MGLLSWRGSIIMMHHDDVGRGADCWRHCHLGIDSRKYAVKLYIIPIVLYVMGRTNISLVKITAAACSVPFVSKSYETMGKVCGGILFSFIHFLIDSYKSPCVDRHRLSSHRSSLSALPQCPTIQTRPTKATQQRTTTTTGRNGTGVCV